MNRKLITVLVVAGTLVAGILLGRMFAPGAPVAGSGDAAGEPEVLYWVAPMDPNYIRHEPGKSPMGMDLVPVYEDEDDSSSTSCLTSTNQRSVSR